MWKKVVALVLLVALAVGVGYVVGIAHVMRTVVCVERPADGTKGIPYPGMICENCFRDYPDWWCILGGCPW